MNINELIAKTYKKSSVTNEKETDMVLNKTNQSDTNDKTVSKTVFKSFSLASLTSSLKQDKVDDKKKFNTSSNFGIGSSIKGKANSNISFASNSNIKKGISSGIKSEGLHSNSETKIVNNDSVNVAAGLAATATETKIVNNDSVNGGSSFGSVNVVNGIVKVPKTEAPVIQKDSIYRRVAKFLMIIGIDEAAKILPHLSENQTEKIIPEIASIQSVDPVEAKLILEEFQGLLEKSRESGGVETARNILEKAYGSKKAQEVIDKAAVFASSRPFEYLNDADPQRILLLLSEEGDGVQALVLSYLEPKKAASVLNLMNASQKAMVIKRLARLEKVSPEVLKRMDKVLHEKSLAQTSEKAENIDGKNALAQILKRMDYKNESALLSSLAKSDMALCEDIRKRLWTIDDIVQGDSRFIENQLLQMDDLSIAKLIAFKEKPFVEKILSCVSENRKKTIIEEVQLNSQFRKSDCEIIFNDFFSILRRAYEEGRFIVKNRNDDDVFV